MVTNEVWTSTHLFHFINYHIFILGQNISKWEKKITTEHISDCKFTIFVVHILHVQYMVNIASQRIYGITFLLCKIHLEFHNIHALFGHNSV